MELNRNPENYFAEVEQATFEPSNIVPGIGFSPDKGSVAPATQIEYTCPIARARRLCRATMHDIWENLFFAFVYNTTGVPLAAGILYPAFELLLSPMLAAAAITLRIAFVIANALRLRKLAL